MARRVWHYSGAPLFWAGITISLPRAAVAAAFPTRTACKDFAGGSNPCGPEPIALVSLFDLNFGQGLEVLLHVFPFQLEILCAKPPANLMHHDERKERTKHMAPNRLVTLVVVNGGRKVRRVAGRFPHPASALRLVSAVLMEISEDWETGRVYFNMDAEKPARSP